MSRFHSYINTATYICSQYNGSVPLAAYLKDFFSAQKKYGSSDRKTITQLCYQYYRVGWLLKKMAVAEPFVAAHFLCEPASTPLLQVLHPVFARHATDSLPEKLKVLHPDATTADLFPFAAALQHHANKTAFCQSLLQQPDVYIRIRPGKRKQVLQQLEHAQISFEEPLPNCLQLKAGTKLSSIVQPDADAVIQDISSQQVISYLQENKLSLTSTPNIWDCCAASGGKSLLIYDWLQGELQLTVSDNRKKILQELESRFARADIKKYHRFVADLTQPQQLPHPYHLIICDAPCTGSGTWSRTPEQLYFFEPSQIAAYAQLQFDIARNVSQHLHRGGLLLYITCSVFEAENQGVVNRLQNECGLQLLQMHNVYGYSKNADSLFWAVLQKNEV
jgi:16S rRNA (cytosine967-C5)-methyltransferase